MRRGVDDRLMNACFDAKLLHVACKNCCIFVLRFICLSSFSSLWFSICARRGTDPEAAARKTAYSRMQVAAAQSVLRRAILAHKQRIQAGLNSLMWF
jgi:hypothetical protein